MEAYSGQQFVGIDLHRRRSVIVRVCPRSWIRLVASSAVRCQSRRAWQIVLQSAGVRSGMLSGPALLVVEASRDHGGPAHGAIVFSHVERSGDALNAEGLTGRNDRKASAGQEG